MESKGLWYFAHPYTVKDADGNYVFEGEEANFRLCCIRAAELLKRGYNVYAPICHTHPIHRACPEFLARHEHEIWYALDNEFIARTDFDGIILAPGWAQSEGCRAEHAAFIDRGALIRNYAQLVGGEYDEAT